MPIHLRHEAPEDAPAVFRVHATAFPTDGEARLVAKLRATLPTLSLVALDDEEIVGHALFTRVTIEEEGGGTSHAMALGPVAVVPESQRRGVGSRLVRSGLEGCVGRGEPCVFVLGDPAYYGRFGFEPAVPHGLHYDHGELDRYFQLVELRPGALRGRRGTVRYHAAFDGL